MIGGWKLCRIRLRLAVQAVLDRDHSYNYTGRGPGDLVSGVVEMDLPGDAAQRLTLATAIPKADPLQPLSNVPAALKEVYATAKADIHSIDFTSRALSRLDNPDGAGVSEIVVLRFRLPPGLD